MEEKTSVLEVEPPFWRKKASRMEEETSRMEAEPPFRRFLILWVGGFGDVDVLGEDLGRWPDG